MTPSIADRELRTVELASLVLVFTLGFALLGRPADPATATSLFAPGDDPATQVLLLAGRLLAFFVCGATLLLMPPAVLLLAHRAALVGATLVDELELRGVTSRLVAVATYALLEGLLALRAIAAGWGLHRPSRATARSWALTSSWCAALLLLAFSRLRHLSWNAQALVGGLVLALSALAWLGGWRRARVGDHATALRQ